MKKRILATALSLLLLPGWFSAANASLILQEHGFHLDDSYTESAFGDAILPEVDASAFDLDTGLGTINVTVIGTGNHHFLAYFDHDIDPATNTFFNEFGATSGTPDAGQSWQIDDPFASIYDAFIDNTLSNTNAVPAAAPDDVSMAMGWNFTLAAGEQALITLALGNTMPGSGFYLAQTDPDSSKSIYFTGNLGVSAVPIPAAALLFATGLAGLLGLSRRRKD